MAKFFPRLPCVKDIVKIYNLTAKSQLSQNFILDKNVTDKILKLSNLNFEKSLVVEVGPGPGLLTRSIIGAGANNLVVVEKDDRFLPSLDQLSEVIDGSLKVVHGDMLKVTPETIWGHSSIKKEDVENVHIIGNLPFSIATPLFLQWLHMFHSRSGLFSQRSGSLTLMFQEEVAERIISKTGLKTRGRLSIMAQSVCDSKLIYRVPASAFVPKPKVNAAVIQLRSLDQSPLSVPLTGLENLVRVFFQKRRKFMRRIALDYDPILFQAIKEAEIPEEARPQDISALQFCQLANLIHEKYPQLLTKKI